MRYGHCKRELFLDVHYTVFLSFVLVIQSYQSFTVYLNYSFNKCFPRPLLILLKNLISFACDGKYQFCHVSENVLSNTLLAACGSMLLKNRLLKLKRQIPNIRLLIDFFICSFSTTILLRWRRAQFRECLRRATRCSFATWGQTASLHDKF